MKINPTIRKNNRMMFDFKVSFTIGLEELAYAVYSQMHIFDRPLPLLRKECLELLKTDLEQGNHMRDDWADDLNEKEFETIKIAVGRLFPELVNKCN